MRNGARIETILFKCIPAKSPDVCPFDYYAFGLLKRAHLKQYSKTLDGFWKIMKEKLNKINLDVLRKSLSPWKLRGNMRVKLKGYLIEHITK